MVIAAWGFDNLDLGVPGRCDQLVDREGFALGYSELHEQPLWVSYRLTVDEVRLTSARRCGGFSADESIETGSAESCDYVRSGYDRGHMAPAADMRYSMVAMRNSFRMSNISPQLPELNRGSWAKLEKWVRDMAVEEGSIVITTGPIFDSDPQRIGFNGVAVPVAFYKVVYDETPPCKMIGFVMSNMVDSVSVEDSACSVDYVEALTGLDFFSNLPDEEQWMLQSRCALEDWVGKHGQDNN